MSQSAEEIQAEIDGIQERRHFEPIRSGALQVSGLPRDYREDYQRLALLVREAKQQKLPVTVPEYGVTPRGVPPRARHEVTKVKLAPLRKV